MRRKNYVAWAISGPADLLTAIDVLALSEDITRRQWVIRACRAALAGTTPPQIPTGHDNNGPISFEED